ncbi:hydrolase [Mycobacterium sp. MS1601]|uniref:fumarylacetoacetate hydrolase family protein n=1 Tax=Mycobacterium sp. MS1601 TaxID=1936029 RepID=UPI00097907D8|nr:fumarylacetoacetate hydrolase family protein [Mycobacterium sp. MS1601]AQA01370.1 hydrolase [Mycobacterium sp. MS1601]
MKYVHFRHGNQWAVGQLTDDNTILEVHSSDPTLGVLALVEEGSVAAAPRRGQTHHVDDVELGAPFPLPRRNIFCVGKNYREHAAEFAGSGYDSGAAQVIPKFPIIFTKAPSSVTGPDTRVTVSENLSHELDYEAELAVIIGTGGRHITKEKALEHVWGYTLVNDLTARDLQRDHQQWFLGKSPDNFAPMGPWAVTKDEINLDDTVITCTVNGELRQKANTADLIFDIPTLIHTISAVMTLQPGDIIATGTPAGVGIGYTPPQFLADGDLVEVTATGLGTLRTHIHFE